MNTDKIKYFVMDVDGTLTNGKLYISEDRELLKSFDVKDGYGICNILIPNGILPVIISGRESKIVETRCKELNIIHYFQGIKDKKKCLDEILYERRDSYMNVAFIGDDLNDIECMNTVKYLGGKVGCPLDAVEEIKIISDFVSTKGGGDGAVREFIEWIMYYRNRRGMKELK